MATAEKQCSCGNRIPADEPAMVEAGLCSWCYGWKDEPPHKGHWSLFGTCWCDTCNSPYCKMA